MEKIKEKGNNKLSFLLPIIVGGVIGFIGAIYSIVSNIELDSIFLDVGIILIFCLITFFLHLILHEGGHLIFGLLSNYEFVSFRVGSFTLVKDDNKFKLKGCDLYTDLLLTPWEAALGTRAIVQSIDDETKVYIPQGIQSGEKIRIPNKGYQSSKTTRGDLVAEIKIVVPKQLTQQEEKIFKKLNEISNFNPRK